jgi:hypothetical protein
VRRHPAAGAVALTISHLSKGVSFSGWDRASWKTPFLADFEKPVTGKASR